MSTLDDAPTVVSFGEDVLERMVLAVEKVRERLRRATAALDASGIPYAVIGGNAVAGWVSKVDPGVARNTVDVDLMVNRSDLDAIKAALGKAGFVHHELLDVHMFLDGPNGRPRDAVKLAFANERQAQHDFVAAPSIENNVSVLDSLKVLAIQPLVEMTLNAHRVIDRVHVRDLIEVGVIDDQWPSRLEPQLATRLQVLLNNPDG